MEYYVRAANGATWAGRMRGWSKCAAVLCADQLQARFPTETFTVLPLTDENGARDFPPHPLTSHTCAA